MPGDHMDDLYNAKNPLVRFVHRQRLSEIVKIVPRKEGVAVLDAGCGEGHLLAELYKKNDCGAYYGADVTAVALERARERCSFAHFYHGDLSHLDFNDGSFDVIIATEVLEHIIEYEEVMHELLRVLKKGGVLIVTFPNEVLWTVSRFFLGRRPIKIIDHVNSFTPDTMKEMVGLAVVKQRNLPFSLPFSVSLGSLIEFRK
ncbi:class I SAM-dependent methyltransferase [Candidatus Azambacteria bacterium]|nr:class I SAM-dependent methyltransferase [Candidatus Azambacteria bacterium]